MRSRALGEFGEVRHVLICHARIKIGPGEIRTHETLSGLPVFKTGAFNRSATGPCKIQGGEGVSPHLLGESLSLRRRASNHELARCGFVDLRRNC
jgi:hypothetical protein